MVGTPVNALPSPAKEPVNEPVTPAVTFSEPVTVELFCAMSPLRAMNSFAIFS